MWHDEHRESLWAQKNDRDHVEFHLITFWRCASINIKKTSLSLFQSRAQTNHTHTNTLTQRWTLFTFILRRFFFGPFLFFHISFIQTLVDSWSGRNEGMSRCSYVLFICSVSIWFRWIFALGSHDGLTHFHGINLVCFFPSPWISSVWVQIVLWV